jgi:transposase InsO family protein
LLSPLEPRGIVPAQDPVDGARVQPELRADPIRTETLTDNGSAYRSDQFAAACRAAGLRHTRTKVRHPWTNGRAERFIGTIQRECAYRDHFTSDDERALAIALFVPWYNTRRPHAALGGLTPQGWLDRWRVTQVYE